MQHPAGYRPRSLRVAFYYKHERIQGRYVRKLVDELITRGTICLKEEVRPSARPTSAQHRSNGRTVKDRDMSSCDLNSQEIELSPNHDAEQRESS